MLTPLKLPPGLFRNGTAYQSEGRWFNASLVRSFEGAIRPVGGWTELIAEGATTLQSIFMDTFTGTLGTFLENHVADSPASSTWVPAAGQATKLILDGAGNVSPDIDNTGNEVRYTNQSDLGTWVVGQEAYFETGPLPASGNSIIGMIYLANAAGTDSYEMQPQLAFVSGVAWKISFLYCKVVGSGTVDAVRSKTFSTADGLTNDTGLATGTAYRFGVTLTSLTQMDCWREDVGGGNRLALASWVGNVLGLQASFVDATHTHMGVKMRLVNAPNPRTISTLSTSRAAASTAITLTGIPRAVLGWRDFAGNQVLGVGTNSKLYAQTIGRLYDLTPAGFIAGGEDSAVLTTGGVGTGKYGDLLYGGGPYSSFDPAQQSLVRAAVWHLDTFGQYLVGCCAPNDGRLYYWTKDVNTIALPMTNSPVGCIGIVVTPERFVFALGAGGIARRVEWASQETLDTWTPDLLTNSAGGASVEGVGNLVAGRRAKGETLLWTDDDLHAARYIGQPLVYAFEKVGSKCGLIAPGAAAVLGTTAVWMGFRNFYRYDGYVQPVPCEVSDYIFSDLNYDQTQKITCMTYSRFGVVRWHYPSRSSTENDRYVEWNQQENHWMTGNLIRTCGVDSGALAFPVMGAPHTTSGQGKLFEHEKGLTHFAADGSTALPVFIESGPLQLGSGDQIMYVSQIIPDEKTGGDARLSLYTRFYPNGAETLQGPFTIAALTDVRFSGRSVRVRIDQAKEVDWRFGTARLDVKPAGAR